MNVGTGKSRTDRHRISFKPTEYRIFRKIQNQEKNMGKNGENENENGWINFLTEFLVTIFQ